MRKGTKVREIIRYDFDGMQRQTDEIAVEFPLTIMLNGEEIGTMVCTPLDMENLVVGYLASEGMIRKADQIKELKIDEERGFAYVEAPSASGRTHPLEKRWLGSCCGKSRAFYFQSDAITARTVTSTLIIRPEQCLALMEEFHQSASMFQHTGGVHQASIATTAGIEVTFADIGRHNALDKLLGYMMKHKLPRKDRVILFSGRISSEVLLKVSKMGIGCLLSKSAPTDLALQLADDLNITAIGFVRGSRMNIYTHPERIGEVEASSTK
ncbi:formate dehydrogenase accessory sulfurtransferase FdhD [Halobacillus fulvus]|nr:formate dehydrogenase accessory sulfurtransferase FdhD [Halobacillus fulvus]